MARWLKQSTSVDVPIGPFVDPSDGSAETGLTLTQPDIRLKKNGAAWAQKAAAQTLTHEENGFYEVTLDATDTNTLGLLRVAVAESGALIVTEDFLIVPANIYDSFFSTDLLQVDAREWLGGTIATPTATGVPEVDVTHWIGTAVATPTTAGVPEVDVTFVAGTAQSAGDIIGDTNDIQSRLPAALTGGKMESNVGTITAGAITAAAIATGAIDADAIASDAITAAKIATGAIDADALAADAGTEIAAAVWAKVVEANGSYTAQQVMSVALAVLAGVTTTNGAVLKDPAGTSTRVSATIDANNNRTAMTLTPSS